MDEPRRTVVDESILKTLFGKPSRILLAGWILDRQGKPFFASEAQRAMSLVNIVPSSIAKDLKDFVDCGMLIRVPEPGRIYFSTTPSALWRCFETLAATCLDVAASNV